LSKYVSKSYENVWLLVPLRQIKQTNSYKSASDRFSKYLWIFGAYFSSFNE